MTDIKNGVLTFINSNQGLLLKFTTAIQEIISIDFTEIILNSFLNYIILVIIKQRNQTYIEIDLNTLNVTQNYNSLVNSSNYAFEVKEIL